jgi:hypothetical protein
MTNQYAPPTSNLDALPNEGGGITSAMLEALRKTKGWVLLVGVMLFVLAAFTTLAALAMVFASSMMGAASTALPRGMSIAIGAFYFVFAFIYGALGFYLLKYSGAISRLTGDASSESMEVALQYQQKFWRLAGVIALLFVVIFVFGIIAGIMGSKLWSFIR